MTQIELIPLTTTTAARENVVYHNGGEDLHVLMWVSAVGEPVTVQLDEWNIGSANTEPHVVPEGETTVFAFDVGNRRGLSILPDAGGTAVYRVVAVSRA